MRVSVSTQGELKACSEKERGKKEPGREKSAKGGTEKGADICAEI